MAKGADAAMRAICEAVGKRETVRVGFMGRCAFLLIPLCTFNTHIFFLDPFITNNLSGHVAVQ